MSDMKKMVALFFSLFITTAALFLIFNPTKTKVMANPEEDRKMEIFSEPDDSIIALKYNLKSEIVSLIFKEYDATMGISDDAKASIQNVKNKEELIQALSNKYSIPSSSIASMIFDREILNKESNLFENPNSADLRSI